MNQQQPARSQQVVTMAHGSGGRAMQQMIERMFLSAFANPWLDEREDSARLSIADLGQQGDRLAFTTDSYVIDPIFFPGGNIGTLAVCGTANDLAVCGATPNYLSCGFILEEGLALDDLQAIVNAMAQTAQAAGIAIVTGDTKVVQRGAADKIFINTAGIGAIPATVNWAAKNIQPGDKIVVSGTLGDHGAAILNLREGLGMDLGVQSDCAVLAPLIAPLRAGSGVHALRDATRGGVNAILHEFAEACGYGITIDEAALPVKPAVRGICELLGLEPLNFANEGKVVLAVAAEAEEAVLNLLRRHPLGVDAATIGEVTPTPQVTLRGLLGVSRQLMLPHAEPLPRIC
ncbi:hydrogenase expression/formation protein HypE [Pantoea alhagi]|uniref:hydrogenase expression/formation protein HypE n=1 Tax=Mixta sp. BE291 TaxID=3158787 RepID=UPI0028609D13|nr:hydrogenase expression/formation protein HypE [Pantoea alhagi]